MKLEFHTGDTVLLRGPEPGGEPFAYGFNGQMSRLVGIPIELGNEIRNGNRVVGFKINDPECGYEWSWDINFIDPCDPAMEVSDEAFNSIFD